MFKFFFLSIFTVPTSGFGTNLYTKQYPIDFNHKMPIYDIDIENIRTTQVISLRGFFMRYVSVEQNKMKGTTYYTQKALL